MAWRVYVHKQPLWVPMLLKLATGILVTCPALFNAVSVIIMIMGGENRSIICVLMYSLLPHIVHIRVSFVYGQGMILYFASVVSPGTCHRAPWLLESGQESYEVLFQQETVRKGASSESA
jgi:hypothetical protein